MNNSVENTDQEYALIVQHSVRGQQHTEQLLRLMLSYFYGVHTIRVDDSVRASALLKDGDHNICCTFVIQQQDQPISWTEVALLSQKGASPLFLLLPKALMAAHKKFEDAKNVFLYPQEQIDSQAEPSLRQVVDDVFERNSIGGVFDLDKHVSQETLKGRVEHRVKHLDTLPTQPKIVQRIIEMGKDPDVSIEDIAELLISDPAILFKLIQAKNSANTPHTAGRQEAQSLRETISHLGWKKVGLIVLQVKLMDNLVEPEESGFDLHRFWTHSLGCALIADKLYKEQLVPLKEEIEFDDYWIAALLHDIGKLVLGFFYWSVFNAVRGQMSDDRNSFHEAETHFGKVISHEEVGQLLLLKANAKQEVVEAVGAHHNPGPQPSSLTCLIHLADNLCMDLGLADFKEERGIYSEHILETLGLTQGDVQNLQKLLGTSIAEEIQQRIERIF